MSKMSITFKQVKATKNTIRFDEVIPDDDIAKIGALYLQKSAAKELGFPESLTVTVEAG